MALNKCFEIAICKLIVGEFMWRYKYNETELKDS